MANTLFDKNYATAISNLFFEALEAKESTLEKMAIATGVKYNTLFRYMNGSRQMPIDLFQKICEYLELDFADTFRLVNQIAVEATVKQYSLINKLER